MKKSTKDRTKRKGICCKILSLMCDREFAPMKSLYVCLNKIWTLVTWVYMEIRIFESHMAHDLKKNDRRLMTLEKTNQSFLKTIHLFGYQKPSVQTYTHIHTHTLVFLYCKVHMVCFTMGIVCFLPHTYFLTCSNFFLIENLLYYIYIVLLPSPPYIAPSNPDIFLLNIYIFPYHYYFLH